MNIDCKPELEELIHNIGSRPGYKGQPIPASIMRMFEIYQNDVSQGILVPYWIPVIQSGRGPRKSNKDHGLVYKILAWMRRKNMFKSLTPEGQFAEAKSLTWYINKYGNEHFRSKVFVDVYYAEREKTVEKIISKYSRAVVKITMDSL